MMPRPPPQLGLDGSWGVKVLAAALLVASCAQGMDPGLSGSGTRDGGQVIFVDDPDGSVASNPSADGPSCSATDEDCDGEDDDCDGTADDDYVPVATQCGTGVCESSGMTSCVDGAESDSCVPGAGLSTDEDCDGEDDDCDGTADDDYVPAATQCGTGPCETTGELSCVDGVETDSCVAGDGLSSDDDCDGVDDDCNGTKDDEYESVATQCGTGVCQSSGFTSCSNGVESDSCVPGGGLSTICDGETAVSCEASGSTVDCLSQRLHCDWSEGLDTFGCVPRFTHQVDVFLYSDLTTCMTGDPCASGDINDCVRLFEADGSIAAAWEKAGFLAVPPDNPLVTTAALVECINPQIPASGVSQIEADFQQLRDNVWDWTSGVLDLEVLVHELPPVELTMGQWGTTLWPYPGQVGDEAMAYLSDDTDFIMTITSDHDPDSGRKTSVHSCYGLYNASAGRAGASYVWFPYRQGGNCASLGNFTGAWFINLHWALNNLSGWTDAYDGLYPTTPENAPDCGAQTFGPHEWFPAGGHCKTDPDSPYCGLGSCDDPDVWHEHILSTHFPPDQVLIANHCTDEIQNYGETDVDEGGHCLP